jgi:hypothetical protein
MVTNLHDTSIAIIVASGNANVLREWLERSLPHLRPDANTLVVFVPWGTQQSDLNRMTPSELLICAPSSDTSLEGNRNTALNYLQRSPPDLVAFIDDDAFVGPGWLTAMRYAAITQPNTSAFASNVSFEGTGEVQSKGHAFTRAAPHDRGFRGHCLDRPVLCPCGNSAVVRWAAIERIWKVDQAAWDPLFAQWQTCFDFGLKLVLTGSVSDIVSDAHAIHRGYCAWTAAEKEDKARQSVFGQLRSRFLLYKKFLPKKLEAAACAEMNVKKWRSQGYTGFESIVGPELDAVVAEAKQAATLLAAQHDHSSWQERFAAREDGWDLLNLNHP